MADITVTKRSVRPLPGAISRDFTASSAGSVGDAVYIDSAGKVAQTNAAAVGTSKALGIVISAGSIGQTVFAIGDVCSVLLFGFVNGYAGMTPGNAVYLSAANAGQLANAAPAGGGDVTLIVGMSALADTIFVVPTVSDISGVAVPALVDSTGGTPAVTFAAIAAGAEYAQADMVAVKNALAQVVLSVNAIRAALAANGIVVQ